MITRRMLILFAVVLTLVVALPLGGSAQGNSGNAKLCQKGNWALLAGAEDPYTAFGNQDDCVSYGAHGGEIVNLTFVEVTIGPRDVDRCTTTWRLHNAQPNTTVKVNSIFNDGHYHWILDSSTPEQSGPISPGSYTTRSNAFVENTNEPVEVFYPTTACGE